MRRTYRNTGPDAATRDSVYERDGMRCALCGAGDNRLSNLLLLCDFGGCHDLIAESQRTRATLNGWLVRTGFDPQDVPVIWHGCLVFLYDDGSVTPVTEGAA
jgi:hypothetical protein